MATQTSMERPQWVKKIPQRHKPLSQLWQVPTFLLGFTLLAVVALGSATFHGKEQLQIQKQLATIQERLKQPDNDLNSLRDETTALVDRALPYPQHAAVAHLFLGEIITELADPLTAGDEKEKELALAKAQLQLAEAAGVPEDLQPRLWFLLGKVLFAANSDREQIIFYLDKALPKGTDDPAEGYGMLVDLYLRGPNPDVTLALKANEMQIKHSNDETVLSPARLLRGQLLVQQERYDSALAVLLRIPDDAPASIRHRSLFLQAIATEAKEQWHEAAPLWEKLLEFADVVPGGRRRILFNLGRCFASMTPPQLVRAHDAWLLTTVEGGYEGQAAQLYLAKLELQKSPVAIDNVLTYVNGSLKDTQPKSLLQNPFIKQQELKAILQGSILAAISLERFGIAENLVQVYANWENPLTISQMLGDLHETWARHLELQIESATTKQDVNLVREAKQHWRLAGQHWQDVSSQAKGENRLSGLMAAAKAYEHAGDHAKNIPLFQECLALTKDTQSTAEIYFLLGQAYQAESKNADALKAYYRCLEYADTTYAYEARYTIACIKSETLELAEAESLLTQNLSGEGRDLAPKAHEKSLYKLGMLLYRQGRFSKASLYLREAALQYPNHAEVLFVRDLLGDSYRKLAQQLNEELLANSNTPSPANNYTKRKRLDWLEQAYGTYQRLWDDLTLMQKKEKLTGKLDRLNRKAAFAVADLQFEMNNFSEALRLYDTLLVMYRGQIEELIACQRIWRCAATVKQQPSVQSEALQTLRTALKSVKTSFDSIPSEHFQGEGTWSRSDWQAWFAEVERQLNQQTSAYRGKNDE